MVFWARTVVLDRWHRRIGGWRDVGNGGEEFEQFTISLERQQVYLATEYPCLNVSTCVDNITRTFRRL